MQDTFAKISPMDIVEAFKKEENGKPKEVAQALWDKFGDDTIVVIAAGSDCLARLWRGAWNAGNGAQKVKSLDAIKPSVMAGIYQPFDFLQSETLNSITPVLATGNGGADGSVKTGKHKSSKAPRGKRAPAKRG
jgi:hypothetical protein